MSNVDTNNPDTDLDGNTLVIAEVDVTISGLHTFDRSGGVPFGVGAGADKVTNLDSDKLDGVEGSDYARISADNALLGVQTASAQPRCSVYNNAVQSIANATEVALTFNTESFDVGALHSTSALTSRITITEPGLYLLRAHTTFVAAATGSRLLWLRKNAATEIPGAYDNRAASATVESALNASAIVELAAADYIEAVVYQDSGGPINAGSAGVTGANSLSAVKLW